MTLPLDLWKSILCLAEIIDCPNCYRMSRTVCKIWKKAIDVLSVEFQETAEKDRILHTTLFIHLYGLVNYGEKLPEKVEMILPVWMAIQIPGLRWGGDIQSASTMGFQLEGKEIDSLIPCISPTWAKSPSLVDGESVPLLPAAPKMVCTAKAHRESTMGQLMDVTLSKEGVIVTGTHISLVDRKCRIALGGITIHLKNPKNCMSWHWKFIYREEHQKHVRKRGFFGIVKDSIFSRFF